jgi:Domain of unknown function (DUF4440)
MPATNDVLDLVASWAKAEEANDPAALDRLLAADFVGVGPLGFVLGRDSGWPGSAMGWRTGPSPSRTLPSATTAPRR